MFALAILIGIYCYLILAFGLLGLLYKQAVILLTVIYLACIIFYVSRFPPRRIPFVHLRGVLEEILQYFHVLKKISRLREVPSGTSLRSNNIFIFILLAIIFLQASINLIGALGPELGFDALWYHLTLPKLYLENHSIYYIHGGLLYYSAMPKLTEMLFTAALALNGEILAKLIHFSFGILTCIALFKLSREFFSNKISLIAVVIFYSNLVVGWQSITAYVDLARTFFEIMALWGFVKWWRERKLRRLIESAIMLGLAISTKLLAFGSLLIFSVLIILLYYRHSGKRSIPRISPSPDPRLSRRRAPSSAPSPLGRGDGVRVSSQNDGSNPFYYLFIYWFIALLVPLPWFVFSFVNTGNPIYPFFTDIYKVGFNVDLLNPFRFVREVWAMFMELSDPISPIYMIFLPLVILFFFRHPGKPSPSPSPLGRGDGVRVDSKIIAIYSFIALIVWYFTPRTGGGRFILPYLPAFSIVVAGVLEQVFPPRRSPFGHLRGDLRPILVIIIIIVAVISTLYRGIANSKYIPVIVGKQTKADFLSSNLNFSFGDFYDTDGYFKKYITRDDKVLLYGFHNLYYVDFPFVDSSWIKKGDSFNYIAVQNTDLPKRFRDWILVYLSPNTHVKLYSKGGIRWTY